MTGYHFYGVPIKNRKHKYTPNSSPKPKSRQVLRTGEVSSISSIQNIVPTQWLILRCLRFLVKVLPISVSHNLKTDLFEKGKGNFSVCSYYPHTGDISPLSISLFIFNREKMSFLRSSISVIATIRQITVKNVAQTQRENALKAVTIGNMPRMVDSVSSFCLYHVIYCPFRFRSSRANRMSFNGQWWRTFRCTRPHMLVHMHLAIKGMFVSWNIFGIWPSCNGT